MKSVSVVIPNYNGRSLLERFLPFIVAACEHSTQLRAWEIIVVDDASTDDSVAFLRTAFPFVSILRNEQNSGFSKTANRGLFAAQHDLVLMLNTDIQLPVDYFDLLIPFFEKTDTFGVFSQLISPDGDILESQKVPKWQNTKLTYFDNKAAVEGKSFYLCGGNALIERQKMVELNGYNELFSPFYCEDMDLSIRAWQRGWASYYTSKTACIHQHSASIGTNFSSDDVKKIFVRNRLIISYLYVPQKLFLKFWLKLNWHALVERLRGRSAGYCEAKKLLNQHKPKRTPFDVTRWLSENYSDL